MVERNIFEGEPKTPWQRAKAAVLCLVGCKELTPWEQMKAKVEAIVARAEADPAPKIPLRLFGEEDLDRVRAGGQLFPDAEARWNEDHGA